MRFSLQEGADDFLVKPLAMSTITTLWRYALRTAACPAPAVRSRLPRGEAPSDGLGGGGVGGSSDGLAYPAEHSRPVPPPRLEGIDSSDGSACPHAARQTDQHTPVGIPESQPQAAPQESPLESPVGEDGSLQRPTDQTKPSKMHELESVTDEEEVSVCKQQ